MLQSIHESVSMPAHWGSAGFFILTYLNRSISGWAYSLGGEQLGCPTQTLVVGRKAWSFSIPELTIASKDKRAGIAIHSWQRKRLELAVQLHRWPIIESRLHRRPCPATQERHLGSVLWPGVTFPDPRDDVACGTVFATLTEISSTGWQALVLSEPTS